MTRQTALLVLIVIISGCIISDIECGKYAVDYSALDVEQCTLQQAIACKRIRCLAPCCRNGECQCNCKNS